MEILLDQQEKISKFVEDYEIFNGNDMSYTDFRNKYSIKGDIATP
jgi:hypothetical protein